MQSSKYNNSYSNALNIKGTVRHLAKTLIAKIPQSWSVKLVEVYRAYIRYQCEQKILKASQKQFNRDRTRFELYAPCFANSTAGNFVAWDKDQFRSILTIEYHRIEKGLALPQPRPGFGLTTVTKLPVMVDRYIEKFGFDDMSNICLSVLEKYLEFNHCHQSFNPELETWVTKTSQQYYDCRAILQTGGSQTFNKQELEQFAQLDFSKFFASRHSIRNFTDHSVSLDLINQAVKMAQYTPSVCNRQAARVYVLDKLEDKQKALSYQNGNRGFGHTADKVLVVSANLKSYNSLGERNQCWIDGGMFAMSLVYAFHSLGLGSCCLNWCVEHDVDRAFKQDLNIPESDAIAMLILVGHLPDEMQIAASRRKRLEEVLFFYN